MKKIKAKSPTRVDLAGGTLDLWPLYLFHKDAVTINLAIDIFTFAELTPRKDKKIILKSQDTNSEKTYQNINELISSPAEELELLRVHAAFWKPKTGFELVTKSDAPIGSGISGSSSLGVSLYGVFSKWFKKKYQPDQVIRLLGNLEAQVMKAPTGCQDYYPPFFGGLNMIELSALGPQSKKINLNLKTIEEKFTLVYTGKPHHSGLNNWKIYKSHIDGDIQTKSKLSAVCDVAVDMKAAVLKKDFKKWGDIFQREYDARVTLSPVFTSPEIERLKNISIQNGAESIKICGAGGGGCVFLWSDPKKKRMLEEACVREGFQVLKAKPIQRGLEVKVI